MKVFGYKIQWLLPVSEINDMENALKVAEVLGHKLLDEIRFRDGDLNFIGDFSTKSYGSLQEETVKKELSKEIFANENIKYIELIRK